MYLPAVPRHFSPVSTYFIGPAGMVGGGGPPAFAATETKQQTKHFDKTEIINDAKRFALTSVVPID